LDESLVLSAVPFLKPFCSSPKIVVRLTSLFSYGSELTLIAVIVFIGT